MVLVSVLDLPPFYLPTHHWLSAVQAVDGSSKCLMVFEAVFVLWLLTDKKHLSPFVARKLCHAGSGCVLMLINTNFVACRVFIYAVCISSFVMNWGFFSFLPNFWFGTLRDKGITIYLLLVMAWVYCGHSLRILAPVFLADPAGAVVGKYLDRAAPRYNKKWIGSKTLGGTAAVCLTTFAALVTPTNLIARTGVSLLAGLGEAVGGAYDNLVIALVVIAAYVV